MKLRDKVQQLRPVIDAALAEIAKQHGLQSLKCGGGSLDSDGGNFVLKVQGTLNGGLDRDASRYESMRGAFGLPPLGTKFQSGPWGYTICGLNGTISKVIAQRDSGEKYLFKTDDIDRLCKRVPTRRGK